MSAGVRETGVMVATSAMRGVIVVVGITAANPVSGSERIAPTSQQVVRPIAATRNLERDLVSRYSALAVSI